jgi:signal transduction histidine kinase/ActR/RegA family two-component response regulator
VSMPVHGKSGLLGVLVMAAKEADRFGEDEVNFLRAAGNVIVETAMRIDAEAELFHAHRLESIGQLSGGIAHDFNNLLAIVMGNLQMLREALDESGGPDAQFRLVDSARRAAQRGADLTQKLLTFSRRQALAPAAIEPAVALPELVEMLRRTLGGQIDILYDVAPNCPPCHADPLQLDNAIVNLALNARDALSSGGSIRMGAQAVTVSEQPPERADARLAAGDYVVFHVADNGVGMQPEVLRRACEPFFTTKSSGKGSGLGLSMAYGFAIQSGGALTIESAPGQGTEVRMYFPVANRRSAQSENPPDTRERRNRPADAHRHAQHTILIVDDEVELLALAEAYLTRLGYRVLRAQSASQAIDLLDREPVTLLFTDVALGGGDSGPALAQVARKSRPALPVLFTSGFAQGAFEMGDIDPNAFLPKPFSLEELAARIEALMGAASRSDG